MSQAGNRKPPDSTPQDIAEVNRRGDERREEGDQVIPRPVGGDGVGHALRVVVGREYFSDTLVFDVSESADGGVSASLTVQTMSPQMLA